MTLVHVPSGTDVLAYLGDDDTGDMTQADQRTAHVAVLARSYVRGLGFSADGQQVTDDIAAVIVSATARELGHAPGILREELGGYNAVYDMPSFGFSLRELTVLNVYRRRAT